nr:FxsA family protein [uncultured Tessaracoccus sp.]
MADRPSRPPSPGLVLAVLLAPLVLWVVAEFALLVWMSQHIGWWTLVLLVATSLLGVVILTRQGRRSLQRLREAARDGAGTVRGTGDTGMVVTGSFLLIVPGFLSDLLGLLFVVPFTRPLLRGGFRRAAGWAARRKAARTPDSEVVIEGEVADEGAPPSGGDDDGPPAIEGTVLPAEEPRDQ